jgi:hypothetical protein
LLTWDIDRGAAVAANDFQASSIDRVQAQLAGAPKASRREREVPEPMDETSARQSRYGVFGIWLVAEFASELLQAPRPPRLVEQKADHGVVDLIL